MQKSINKCVGRPIGARHDLDGNITHFQFSHRQRAMPVKKVLSVVKEGRVIGLSVKKSGDNCVVFALDARLVGVSEVEELPEV